MTRAKDAIFGFAADNPDENNGISRLLKEAVDFRNKSCRRIGNNSWPDFTTVSSRYLNLEKCQIQQKNSQLKKKDLVSLEYIVCQQPESLKLKLHGENYFIAGREDVISRINYGKLMHQAFEYIDTAEDIPAAVEKLILEGQIPESDSESMIHRLNELISSPSVADWFKAGNRVMKEADILTAVRQYKKTRQGNSYRGKSCNHRFQVWGG